MSLPVNQNAVDEFIQVWAEYDPDGDGFIEISKLENFMTDLAKEDKEFAMFFWT